MSRQIALQTRSEALRRTRRGLNARQGMEGAKTLTERFRRSGAPIPLARGFRSPGTAPAPAKPICTVQAATRLVGGRRPSVLQRWGSGVSQTVSGCARRCRNRGGSVVLEIGEQNTQGILRRQRAQDRQSTRNCMQCSVDCPPPAAGSLNPAALNDTKAVFECLFVVGYGAFPTKLFIQPVCF